MMNIEEKLAKFREKKNEQKLTEKKKQNFFNFRVSDIFSFSNSEQVSLTKQKESNQNVRRRNLIKPKDKSSILLNEIEETPEAEPEELKIQILKISLKFLLWLVLLVIFIKIEFGLVFFVCSLLVIIYLNTNVGKKSKVSAYSVFNPNFERIQGTITAEQLERNLIKPF